MRSWRHLPVKVYNFEVAGNHTYFVGNDGGIAVHNAACNNIKKPIKGRIGKYKNIRVDVELGGSGYVNAHIHVNNDKFMYDATKKLFTGAPNIINQNKEVAEGLAKAIQEAIKRGWRFPI